jgi:hypothetical protein
MFFALHVIAVSFVSVLSYIFLPQNQPEIDYIVFLHFIGFIIAIYVVRETWVSIGMISKPYLQRLKRMYRLLTASYLILLLFLLFILFAVALIPPTIEIEVYLAYMYLSISIVVLLLFFVLCLRQIRIFLRGSRQEIGFSMENLHRCIENNQINAPAEAKWMVRVDQPLGLFFIIGGAALFLLGAGVYDFAISYALEHFQHFGFSRGAPWQGRLGNLGSYMEILGALCILRGRSYLLPKAEAIYWL